MTINIISVFVIDIVGTETENGLKCKQYLGENEIKLFIILSKTLCFVIYEQPKIIG